VTISTDADNALSVPRAEALQVSHNTGRPPEEWEIRNEQGIMLDPGRSAASYQLGNGAHLFLTLQVGWGG
jgi:hypothetical protein